MNIPDLHYVQLLHVIHENKDMELGTKRNRVAIYRGFPVLAVRIAALLLFHKAVFVVRLLAYKHLLPSYHHTNWAEIEQSV